MKRVHWIQMTLALVALACLLPINLMAEDTILPATKSGQGEVFQHRTNLGVRFTVAKRAISLYFSYRSNNLLTASDDSEVKLCFIPHKNQGICKLPKELKPEQVQNPARFNFVQGQGPKWKTRRGRRTVSFPGSQTIKVGESVLYQLGNEYLLITTKEVVKHIDPEEEIPGFPKVARYQHIWGYVPSEALPKSATRIRREINSAWENRTKKKEIAIYSMKYEWRHWGKTPETFSAEALVAQTPQQSGTATTKFGTVFTIPGLSSTIGLVFKDGGCGNIDLSGEIRKALAKECQCALTKGNIDEIDFARHEVRWKRKYNGRAIYLYASTLSLLRRNTLFAVNVDGKCGLLQVTSIEGDRIAFKWRYIPPQGATDPVKVVADASNVSSGL